MKSSLSILTFKIDFSQLLKLSINFLHMKPDWKRNTKIKSLNLVRFKHILLAQIKMKRKSLFSPVVLNNLKDCQVDLGVVVPILPGVALMDVEEDALEDVQNHNVSFVARWVISCGNVTTVLIKVSLLQVSFMVPIISLAMEEVKEPIK